MPLPEIPVDLWRQFQNTVFGEKADDIQEAESFRWGVDDSVATLPPDDGQDWQAEVRRLEEEQQRRQEEQRRQIEEQARLDQEDYERIADERAVAARANQLASTYNDPTTDGTLSQPLPPAAPVTSTYNDPTAGGTISEPLPTPEPSSFADTANSLMQQTFGPEPAAPEPAPDPPKSVSFADTANSLITGAFGPESTVGSAVSGAYNTAVRGGMPDVARIGQRALESAQEPAIPEAARAGYEAGQKAYEDPMTSAMPGLPRGLAVYNAASGAAGNIISRRVGEQLGTTGEMIADLPIIGPVSSTDVAGVVGETLLDPTNLISAKPAVRAAAPVARRAGEALGREAAEQLMGMTPMPRMAQSSGGGMSRDAIAAIKALRTAGMEEAALNAERELAMKTPMTLEQIQQQTGAAIKKVADAVLPKPPEAPLPAEVPNPFPLTAEERALNTAADARARAAPPHAGYLEDPTFGADVPSAGIADDSVEAGATRFWASADNPAVQRRRIGEDIDDLLTNPDMSHQVSNQAGDAAAADKRAAVVQVARERGIDVHWVRDTAQEQVERERGFATPWEYWQLRSGSEPTGPRPGDAIRLPDGTRARVEAPETDLAPTTYEPPAGPQPGDRVRLPDGTRATVLEGGTPPPPNGRPPAPPSGGPPLPPEGGRQLPMPGLPERPPEDLTHVRGFGILQGVDDVGREALERAAERGRQFPKGVPRASGEEAAVRLGMTPEEVAAKWLRQDTREAADEVAVLRQGVAASLDDVQEAARKARDGALSPEEQQAAVDGLVNAAVGGEFLRGGRRAAESAGRALNQFRSAVQVQGARQIYDAMEAAAQAARRTRVVLEGLKNGKTPNESGLRQLEETAARLEGAAGRDLLGEGGEAVRRRARRDAGLPEPAGAPEGAPASGAPKEPSFAERWGQLKRAHTAAEEAGDTARAADISDQISALSSEVRADAIDRARKAVEQTKKPLTMEEAQRIVDERLGQGPVSRIRREELDQAKGFTAGRLQADLERDVQKKVLAALKRAEAQQDALLKSLDIQTQRGIEKAMAREQRADIKQQARAMADQAKQWMDRAKRDPSNMAFRDEFDQTLREMSEHSNVGEVMAADLRQQFANHLDEHAFQFMSDLERRAGDAERGAIAAERAGIQKEALQGMAQRLRDTVKAARENPNHPGLLEEVDRLMADMTSVSQRGFEMSSDIKKSLTKAGLQRFAGKLSEDQVDQFMGLLRNIDPDDPRALGNIMAYMRRGHALDRVREFSVANMLSSTATASPLGVNNIANILSAAAHYGFKLPGMAAAESVRTLGGLRGTPEVTFGDVGAAYRAAAGAFGPAVQDAVAIVRHGSTNRQAERAAQLADFGGSHPELMGERPQSLADVAKLKWGPVGELLHMLSTRQLEASDAFWSNILESGNYAGLAARKARMSGGKLTAEQILANPLDHMDVLEQAQRMSRYTLLKQRSAGSRVAGSLITAAPGAGTAERWGKFAAQQVIPFTTTPLNSVLQLLEYSPVGAAVQGVRAARTKDGFARAELTNKALAGATLAGIGIAGIQATVPNAPAPEWTWITGAAPIDTEKRKALEAQGWQANSVWNPANRTYNSVMGTPMAPVLFPAWALQGFADAVEKGERKGTAKEWEDWLAQGLGGSAQRLAGSVIEQSFLRSVGDIVQGFGREGDASRLLASEVSRYIPAGSLVAQLARLGDAAQRDPKTVTERVIERTPARGMLPERQGPLGEALPNEMPFPGGLINPSPRRTTEHSNPTYQAFAQAGVDIGAPIDRLPLKQGAGIPLTPAEQRQWATYRGEALTKATATLRADREYAQWSPQEREAVFKRALDRAGAEATGRMLDEMGDKTIDARIVLAGQR